MVATFLVSADGQRHRPRRFTSWWWPCSCSSPSSVAGDPRFRLAAGRRQGAAHVRDAARGNLSEAVRWKGAASTRGGVRPMKELPTTEQRNPASARLDEMPVEVDPLPHERGGPAGARGRRRGPAADRRGGRVAGRGVAFGGALDLHRSGDQRPHRRPGRGRVPAHLRGAARKGRRADRRRQRPPLTRSVEGAEDDRAAAVQDLEDLGLEPSDVVVGLAASGRTPYVVAAVGHASEVGCATVGISNNPGSELGAAARRVHRVDHRGGGSDRFDPTQSRDLAEDGPQHALHRRFHSSGQSVREPDGRPPGRQREAREAGASYSPRGDGVVGGRGRVCCSSRQAAPSRWPS